MNISPTPSRGRFAILCILTGIVSTIPAMAVLIAEDNFEDYTANTNINGQTGGTGWNSPWLVQAIGSSSTGVSNVSSTSITYDFNGNTIGGGNSLMLSNQSNGTQRNVFASEDTSGKDYYVSFIFQYSGTVFTGWQAKDASPNISEDSISVVNTNSSVGARVANQTSSTSADFLTAGTTYFMVTEYSGWDGSNYNTVNVYINPAETQVGSSITATFTDSGGGGSSGFIGTYVRAVIASDEAFYLDSLRIGTDWESITAVPEPGQYAVFLACLAGMVGVLIRRRRK